MKKKIRKISTIFLCLLMVAAVFVVVPMNIGAEEEPPEEPEFPEEPGMMGEGEWWIEGNGTYFELTNSTYLNITLTSSEQVYIHLESIPKVVSYHIEADCLAITTDIILTGFEASETYYKYQDGNLIEIFTTTGEGSYSYTQDISIFHHVFIQKTQTTLYLYESTTLTSDIYESIYIMADDITLDGSGFSVTGSGSYGIYASGKSGITIKNVDVNGFNYGIYLTKSNSNIISMNTVSNNYYGGIYLLRSNYNAIDENIASNNYQCGIYLESSNYNILNGNTVSGSSNGIILYTFYFTCSSNTLSGNIVSDNNLRGIVLDGTSNSILKGNIISSNTYNFQVTGSSLLQYTHDIDTSNTVDGKPIYYLIGVNNLIIDSTINVGYVGIIDSYDITVRDLTLTNNYQSILFAFTSNSRIQDVDVRDNYRGIDLYSSGSNTIISSSVSGNTWGIFLDHSSDNTISGNTVSDGYNTAIYLIYSSGNTLNGNNILGYDYYGIDLVWSSDNNILSGNTVSSNMFGIYLFLSGSTILRHNVMLDNKYNFGVYGNSLPHYIQDIDTSNTVEGKPIYYLIDLSDAEISPITGYGDAGYIGIVNSHHVIVKDLTLTYNNREGVLFAYTSNSEIQNVYVSGHAIGLCIWTSSSNTLTGNTVTGNDASIRLYYSSNYNILTGNTVSGNTYGIWLAGSCNENIINGNMVSLNSHFGFDVRISSNYNIISENTILSNRGTGMYIHSSSNNIIVENQISDNGRGFELLSQSNSNTISGNTISGNIYYGIRIYSSSGNLIYHNNIHGSVTQAHDTNPENNDWHHPDLLEGNYWSDYHGEDIGGMVYPWDTTGKHLIADDGIGDTLVPHYTTDYDYYPLMNPWVPNEPPEANAGGPYEDYEGTEITFDASLSNDPDDDPLQYRWDFNNDGTWDTDWSDSPTAPYTWFDNHGGVAKVEVSDGSLTDTAEADVTVFNANPIITSIFSPIDPLPVGTPTEISALFTDLGILDTHTAEINWSDGEITEGEVDEVDGSGSVTGAHTYTTPGVYIVKLTLWDKDSGEDSISTEYIVQYDPYGAFVTGGGMIDSPPGAFPDDLTLTGKAGFGFVSKYQKGANVPGGNAQFRFHAADINFQSDSYDWLVVAGPKAMFKGTGTINGDGNYGFLISAIDGDMPGGGGVDRFRIKIWDKDNNDEIVYDNGLGDADDADPATPLTHGSIKIHKW